MSNPVKKRARGMAADETPRNELVLEFHAKGAPVEVGAADSTDDIVEAAHQRAEADERASAPRPLLGERRTPGEAPPLNDVPGLVGDFTAWVLEQAARPQPAIARATGLGLVGALTGRQFQTATGLRGNVFFLVIAGTGMGKDAAISAVRRVAQAADCSDFIAGDPGSFRGYHRLLERHPARLFPLDELGKRMLAAQRDARSPERATLDFLLRLYSHSTAAGELPAHVLARPSDCSAAVPQACTALVGFSTEEAWDALTPSAASDGWLPRFLLVEGNPDVVLRRSRITDPPDELVRAIKRVVEDLPDHDYGLAGAPRLEPDAAPRPFTLPEEEATCRLDDDLRHAQDAWAQEARSAGRPWLADLVHRWRENALKLAMLRAASRWSIDRTRSHPILTPGDVLWGAAYAEDSIRRMALALAQRVGANEHDLLIKRVRRELARLAGKEGWVLRSAIRRALGGAIDTRDFDEALRTLDEWSDVETCTSRARSASGAGRPLAMYRLTPAGTRRLEG